MSYSAKQFGERLSKARLQRGLVQADLGKLLGVSHAAVSGWEQGKSRIYLDKAVRLAEALGVSIAWLCGEDGSGLTVALPDDPRKSKHFEGLQASDPEQAKIVWDLVERGFEKLQEMQESSREMRSMIEELRYALETLSEDPARKRVPRVSSAKLNNKDD